MKVNNFVVVVDDIKAAVSEIRLCRNPILLVGLSLNN